MYYKEFAIFTRNMDAVTFYTPTVESTVDCHVTDGHMTEVRPVAEVSRT